MNYLAAAFLRRRFFGAAVAAAAFFLRRFGAAFLAAAFLRRFGAAFLAAAFLRRFGAAFLAAAFLRRFLGAAVAAAFLRRFLGAAVAAAFLRFFGADFLAAAMCLSPNRKGSDPSPKPVSWISVTEFGRKYHYIVRNISVRVANYFFYIFMQFAILKSVFRENLSLISRIFEIFSQISLLNGKFVRFNVIFPHFRQENRQNSDHSDT
jgi:hypothetical protein